MAIILDARVQQKTDTEANWVTNTLPILPGEQAFVSASTGGAILNFKVNTFNEPKLFIELPYYFDASMRVPIFGTAAPADEPTPSTGDGFWIALEQGVYTDFGGVELNAASLGVITRIGGNYSIAQIVLSITTVPEGITNTGYGNIDKLWGPYADKAAANTAIPNTTVSGKSYREGKFVAIGTSPNFKIYWWSGGYTDEYLVEYLSELNGGTEKIGAQDVLTTYTGSTASNYAVLLHSASLKNNGKLTAFNVRCQTAGNIYLVIWRLVSGDNYELIFKQLATLVDGLNTVTVTDGPNLIKGDKVGFINIASGAQLYRKVKSAAGDINRTLTWNVGDVVDISENIDQEYAISATVLKGGLRDIVDENTIDIETLYASMTPRSEFNIVKDEVNGGIVNIGVTDALTTYTNTNATGFAPLLMQHPIQVNGRLQSATVRCNVAGALNIAVWRQVSGTNYQLIIKIPVTCVVGLNTFEFTTGARDVKAGDMFGYINVASGAQVYRKVKANATNVSRTLTWNIGDIVSFSEVHGYEFAINGTVKEYSLDERIIGNDNEISDLQEKDEEFQEIADAVKGGQFSTGATDALTTFTTSGGALYSMVTNTNPLQADGYPISISVRCVTAGQINLCFWRPLDNANNYELVYKKLVTLVIGINTVAIDDVVELKKGDRVGYMEISGQARIYRKVKTASTSASRVLTYAVGNTAPLTEIITYEFAINAIIQEKSIIEKVDELYNSTGTDGIPDFDTAYSLAGQDVVTGFVGGSIWRKRKSGEVGDLLTEANQHNFYHSDHKAVRNVLQNVKWVDCKGTGDSNNPGRILTHISKDGWMYFKNDYLSFRKIRVEDFLANLVDHDGSGTDYTILNWADLPADATDPEKLERFNKEILNWKMVDEANLTTIPVPKPSDQPTAMTTLEFSNGTLINNQYIYRADGTYQQLVLKKPVVGNPTHLIIKNSSNVTLHTIALEQYGTGLRWGKMKANIGDITYTDPIGACINFNNGKEITVPVSLSAGTYKFIIRGRRYGSYLVDGEVEVISGSTVLGSVEMAGNSSSYGYESSAVLMDCEEEITLSSSVTSLKLKAVCADQKNFNPNSFSQGTGRNKWGWTTNGNYGTITEYEPIEKRSGMMYFTSDCGETWQTLFDVSLSGTQYIDEAMTSINTGGGHIHGACVDLYWNKLWIVCGDSDHTKGIYHTDLIEGNINSDNVVWTREPFIKPFYGSANGEQYCSVYAMEKAVIFGTDCIPSGIFRMNRINSEVLTPREPSWIINRTQLSHIPTVYYRQDENSPVLILTMQGDTAATNRLNRVPMIHATYDGQFLKEIWKDNLIQNGFGYNISMSVFEYKGKVFAQIFSDKRFEFNHSLVIGDWDR